MTGTASPFRANARFRRLLLLIATIAVILMALFGLQDQSLLLERLERQWPVLILAALVTSLHFCIEPARWAYYTLGDARLISASHYTRNFYVYATTALMSFSLPFKLGIPLRLYFLQRYLNVSTAKAIQILALDGAFNIALWTLIAAPALLWVAPDQIWQALPLLWLWVLATAALMLISRTQTFQGLLARWRNLDWAAAMPTKRGFVLLSVLLIIDILSYGLRHQLIASAVWSGVLQQDVPLLAIFLAGIVATYVGIASALPMGLGAYDLTLTGLLAAAGVPVEQALLIIAVNRGLTIIVSVVLGGLSSTRLSVNSSELETNVVAEP